MKVDIYRYSDSGNRFSGKFYLDICIGKLYFYENWLCRNSIVLQPITRNDIKKSGFLSLGKAKGPYLKDFSTYFSLFRYKKVKTGSGDKF